MARPSDSNAEFRIDQVYSQRALLPRDCRMTSSSAPSLSNTMSSLGSPTPQPNATAGAISVAQPSPPLTPQRQTPAPACVAKNSGLMAQPPPKAARLLPLQDSASGPQRTAAANMTRNDEMSNVISTMPQQQEYSYPPLEEMGMQDSVQPYTLSEHRPFPHMVGDDRSYEPDHQHQHPHHDSMPQPPPRYPSPPPNSDPYGAPSMHAAHTAQLVTELQNAMGGIEDHEDHKTDDGTHEPESPGRSKPVPKPDRPITKDANGRFYCDWPNCNEVVKDFGRKCEWSKHMDKHDRPYKCPAEGCEKLPGFTYSGGLLRHEREVHNKHGGPRKQLNCPHHNCKRNTGKGFSRQENLNEHLRRVHTDSSTLVDEEMNGMTQDQPHDTLEGGEPGAKRKRRSTGGASQANGEEESLREENKKLRLEVESLKRAHEEISRQLTQLNGQTYSYLATPQMQQQAPMQAQAPMASMQANMQPQMQQSQMPHQMPQPQMQQPQMQQPQMQQQLQVQQAHQQQQQMPSQPQAQQIVQQIAQQHAQAQAQQQAQQQSLPQRMPSAPMM